MPEFIKGKIRPSSDMGVWKSLLISIKTGLKKAPIIPVVNRVINKLKKNNELLWLSSTFLNFCGVIKINAQFRANVKI
jgi:hypothetical protein